MTVRDTTALRLILPFIGLALVAPSSSAQGLVEGPLFPAPNYALLGDPQHLAAGDLDDDGCVDLVVASRMPNVAVLYGECDGTFEKAVYQPQTNPNGASATDVAIADFDLDGILDLAIANRDSDVVVVRLGLGNRSFGFSLGSAAGIMPEVLIVDDFNGDGLPDLAVGNGSASSGGVTVLRGMGDGTFQALPTVLTPTGWTTGLASGDFNEDGIRDVAAVDSSNVQGQAFVFIGAGDGTLTLSSALPIGQAPQGIVAGDLNEDGFDDLLAVNQSSSHVSVYLGLGDGSFMEAPEVPAPGASSIAIGDVDGDGNLDFVTTSGSVMVFLGAGDGSFVQSAMLLSTVNQAIVIVDVDNDGADDLAVASSSGSVTVIAGRGDGTFEAAEPISTPSSAQSLLAGDLDGDGNLDLIAAVPNDGIFVYRGLGGGAFAAGVAYPATAPGLIVMADLNADGSDDLVVRSFVAGMEVLLGNGDASFQLPQNVATDVFPISIETGDLDGNGTIDLAVVDGGDTLTFLGNGDGTFAAPQLVATSNLSAGLLMHDLDGDQVLDLAIADVIDDELTVLLGVGDGTFQAPLTANPGNGPGQIAVGDLNMDGIPDLAVTNVLSTRVLIGKGNGTFFPPQTQMVIGSSIEIGELNGDGIPDLATVSFSGVVSVLIGTGDGALQLARSFVLGEDEALILADFNADGRTDMAAADSAIAILFARGEPLVPVFYCSPKVSSAGCVAQLSTSNPAAQPVSGASVYTVTAEDVQGLKNGILFVSVTGAANIPFHGGTLCMNPPLKRGPLMNSGGTPGTCQGVFSTLVDNGMIIPVGLDAGPGNSATYQYWYRDPGNGPGATGSALSDAVELGFL